MGLVSFSQNDTFSLTFNYKCCKNQPNEVEILEMIFDLLDTETMNNIYDISDSDDEEETVYELVEKKHPFVESVNYYTRKNLGKTNCVKSIEMIKVLTTIAGVKITNDNMYTYFKRDDDIYIPKLRELHNCLCSNQGLCRAFFVECSVDKKYYLIGSVCKDKFLSNDWMQYLKRKKDSNELALTESDKGLLRFKGYLCKLCDKDINTKLYKRPNMCESCFNKRTFNNYDDKIVLKEINTIYMKFDRILYRSFPVDGLLLGYEVYYTYYREDLSKRCHPIKGVVVCLKPLTVLITKYNNKFSNWDWKKQYIFYVKENRDTQLGWLERFIKNTNIDSRLGGITCGIQL